MEVYNLEVTMLSEKAGTQQGGGAAQGVRAAKSSEFRKEKW